LIKNEVHFKIEKFIENIWDTIKIDGVKLLTPLEGRCSYKMTEKCITIALGYVQNEYQLYSKYLPKLTPEDVATILLFHEAGHALDPDLISDRKQMKKIHQQMMEEEIYKSYIDLTYELEKLTINQEEKAWENAKELGEISPHFFEFFKTRYLTTYKMGCQNYRIFTKFNKTDKERSG
jgi:hypothetical protein